MNRAHQIISLLEHYSCIGETVTLEMHDTLNPKLWDLAAQILKPEVRKHLLMIAEKWKDFAKLPPKSTTDVVMLGGNSGYNYTKYSDIDVHWIMHEKDLGNNKDLIQAYMDDKQNLWRDAHPNISVYGYPVELFAMDIKAPFPKGQGAYSLLYNKWVQKPNKVAVDFNDPHLVHKVDQYKKRIDHLILQHASDAAFERIKDRLKGMRGASIAKGGEYAFENLVFKELRNQGYLIKMKDFLHQRQDKRFSLFLKKE